MSGVRRCSTRSTGTSSVVSVPTCRRGSRPRVSDWNDEFTRIHFPARWHYDVLRGLDALLDAGAAYDRASMTP